MLIKSVTFDETENNVHWLILFKSISFQQPVNCLEVHKLYPSRTEDQLLKAYAFLIIDYFFTRKCYVYIQFYHDQSW